MLHTERPHRTTTSAEACTLQPLVESESGIHSHSDAAVSVTGSSRAIYGLAVAANVGLTLEWMLGLTPE